MTIDNYYVRLGVAQNSSQAEIIQSFRTLIRFVHPDKLKDRSESNVNKDSTIQLLQAYRVLSNSEMRKEYDKKLKLMMRNEQISHSRYFQQIDLIYREGKWYAECEQCRGQTQITENDIQLIRIKKGDYFVKCWHCGLALSIIVE